MCTIAIDGDWWQLIMIDSYQCLSLSIFISRNLSQLLRLFSCILGPLSHIWPHTPLCCIESTDIQWCFQEDFPSFTRDIIILLLTWLFPLHWWKPYILHFDLWILVSNCFQIQRLEPKYVFLGILQQYWINADFSYLWWFNGFICSHIYIIHRVTIKIIIPNCLFKFEIVSYIKVIVN